MSQLSVTLFRLITSLTLCYAPLECFTKDLKSVEKVNEIHPGKKQKDFSDSLCSTQIKNCFCMYRLQSSCAAKLVDIQMALIRCHCTWDTSQTTPCFCHIGVALPSKWLSLLCVKNVGFFSLPTKHVYYFLDSLIKKQEFNHHSFARV